MKENCQNPNYLFNHTLNYCPEVMAGIISGSDVHLTLQQKLNNGTLGNLSFSASGNSYLDLLTSLARPDWLKIEHHHWRQWLGERWAWGVYIPVLYILASFLGERLMKYRQPFGLRSILVFWNASLAVGSAIACLGVLPELVYFGRTEGIYGTVCISGATSASFYFWELLGVASKLIEFGDTIFHIMRKTPLIFLHWFHHATVMFYMWFTYAENDPALRWFMVMNTFVHAVMYSYYGFRAAGYKLSRKFSMTVTTLQILQMIAGLGLNFYSLLLLAQGYPCSRKPATVYVASAMYLTYFLLFCQFFVSTYLLPHKRKLKSG